jgi:hypothetical protein
VGPPPAGSSFTDGVPGLTRAIEELWPRADRHPAPFTVSQTTKPSFPKAEGDRAPPPISYARRYERRSPRRPRGPPHNSLTAGRGACFPYVSKVGAPRRISLLLRSREVLTQSAASVVVWSRAGRTGLSDMPVLPLARRIRVRRTSLPADRENHSLRRGLKPGLCISLGAELQVETVLCTVQALELYVEIGAGHSLSARAHRSHVLIRRRTVAGDEGIPPLLRMTRDRHALPTAGFRFALAKRASGEGRPARAVLVPGSSRIRRGAFYRSGGGSGRFWLTRSAGAATQLSPSHRGARPRPGGRR